MAIFSLLTLTFTLCESGYVENGFTFFAFKSEIITRYYSWAIYLIGVLSILFLLISLALITFSIFNFFLKKRFNFNLIIAIVSIVIAALYMIIGIVFVSVSKATWGSKYYFTTSAYIPLIIQAVLLAAHIVCGKIKISAVSTKDKSQNSVLSTPVLNKAISEEQQIIKYKEMLDNGIITEEEFNGKKRKILGL